MDEELEPDSENVNSILAQEFSELYCILSGQSPTVIKDLCKMMPGGESVVREPIKAMLEYFRTANVEECRNFLQSLCMQCENMPMHLESKLISVAGYANTDGIQSATKETLTLRNKGDCKSFQAPVTEKCSSPLSERQRFKRPRIDYWQQYIAAVTNHLLARWERVSKHLLREVQLENVWISLRSSNKGKDRPDQTPGFIDRGSRTPEPHGDLVSLEPKVTLEAFLQGCTGKVTVIAGPAGSGKTLLMSCLGQQWAQRLGPVPSSYLFILLEFRHLNLLSSPISLSELLLQHYLPPDGHDDEKIFGQRAIVDYLISNPEQSCWVLDGYDEFHSKLLRLDIQGEQLHPDTRLSVAEIVSGLLHRHLLPGCTVMITCRLRDVVDLENSADKVGQLLGWNHDEIKEYVDNFFGGQGEENRALREQTTSHLFSSRHLLAMSSVPALCNICCICLKYLLLEYKGKELGVQSTSNERESLSRIKGIEDERKQASTSGMSNGRAQLPPKSDQIPLTLTQVYLTFLSVILRIDSDKDKYKSKNLQQSAFCWLDPLIQYRSELCELTQIAWSGLEKRKILFMEDEITPNVLDLFVRTGLFTQVELRCEKEKAVNAYCFILLTIQEFLAALKVMSSNDVSETQLKHRFSLKTRWMTKADQKTAFTDSFHLYVCGLASLRCTQGLVQLATASVGTGAQSWVQKRQSLVLKLLKKKCQSNILTGPKILELCHCIKESQDNQLAKEFVGTRPTLELRNIPLSSNDIDALAFVVSSVGQNGIGLDFGACSMEPECLDVLPSCRYINCLSFRSRKYGDKFAEKLAEILPKFTTLKKLEFCGASLTATGAASLASALQRCRDMAEINLSDNYLRDEGIRCIADIFTDLPNLNSVMLGRNYTTLQALDYLIGKMPQCLNIHYVHADGIKDIKVTFFQNSGNNSNKKPSSVSLLNQKWSTPDMQKLANSLACCPGLSVLDLSGGLWNLDILRTLTKFLQKFHIIKQVILNGSCSSVDSVVVLTALLSDCPTVVDLHIRLQSSSGPNQVSIMFSGETEKPAVNMTKTLCLSCCDLLPADLDRVWQSFGLSCDLNVLDLSYNRISNQSLKKLLEVLPHLCNIQEINASNNDINMKGVFTLADALCSHNNLTQIHISDGGQDQVLLKFSRDISYDKWQHKVFRINNSRLLPSDITSLCNRLAECPCSLELDFSQSSLNDQAVRNLLGVLPKMESLWRLDVSHSITSTTGAIILVSSLTVNQRVTSVELSPQSDSFIHFDSVKAEQASCRLTHFDLSSSNLEQLLLILQKGPRMSYLDLSFDKMEDVGLKHLVEFLPSLKITNYVNLSNNCLTHHGLLDVVSVLSTCNNVSSVEISLGTEKRCLIWFRQCESCEKTLSVKESSLKHEHLIKLAEIVSNCCSPIKLIIKEDWIREEQAVRVVCCCLDLIKNIETIKVHQTTLHLFLTTVSIYFTDLTSSLITKKIGLVDCGVKGPQLEQMRGIIQKCPLLTELDFSHNSLGIEGAEFLCSVLPSLPNLTSLSIGSKEAFPDLLEKLTEVLLQSTSVRNLNLSGHVIGETAAHIVSKMFPRLLSLNLANCKWSTVARLQLFKALEECVSLENICMDLDDESITCLPQALRKNKSLQSFKIPATTGPPSASDVLDLLAAMCDLSRVKDIELEGWKMAEMGVRHLTRLLPAWTNLRKISLSKNFINDPSGDKLVGALVSCVCLEELNLSSNNLGDLTAARMALVLPSLKHMTVLNISENKIGCEGSVNLSEAIKCMRKLTKLNLTAVGTSKLCPVAASLVNCPFIQDVGLGWNNCGDEVALELAKVLLSCQNFTRLDLESNRVSVVGAEALLKAVHSCPALQLIRLWRNKLSPIEAKRLNEKDRRLNFSPT